jgi:hypothetical protein
MNSEHYTAMLMALHGKEAEGFTATLEGGGAACTFLKWSHPHGPSILATPGWGTDTLIPCNIYMTAQDLAEGDPIQHEMDPEVSWTGNVKRDVAIYIEAMRPVFKKVLEMSQVVTAMMCPSGCEPSDACWGCWFTSDPNNE